MFWLCSWWQYYCCNFLCCCCSSSSFCSFMIACCTMDIDLLSVVVRSVWLYKGKEIRMTTAMAPRTVKFRLVWIMPCVVARSANVVFQAIFCDVDSDCVSLTVCVGRVRHGQNVKKINDNDDAFQYSNFSVFIICGCDVRVCCYLLRLIS